MTRVVHSSTPTPLVLLLAVAILFSGCRTTTENSTYSAEAHQRAAQLKTETIALMAKSGEPYSQYRSEVEALNGRIQGAYEAAASTPGNELVASQWEVMKNPEGDLYGGFAKRWQTNGRVDEAFREERIVQASAAFDYILCLEVAKKRGGQCTTGAAQ